MRTADHPPLPRLYRTSASLLQRGSVLFVLALAILSIRPSAYGQRNPGSMGLGLQFGQPGGAAVKLYRPDAIAYDAVLTTDGDDFITSHVHRVWEHPVPDSPLHFFVGPGLQLGARTLTRSPQLHFGVSSEVGLNFYAERFEVFLHVTPALRFFPNRASSLDGNVGLRYYFGL